MTAMEERLTDSPLKFMYAWGLTNKIGTSPTAPVLVTKRIQNKRTNTIAGNYMNQKQEIGEKRTYPN